MVTPCCLSCPKSLAKNRFAATSPTTAPQLVIRQIYITCVRPILEYASRAWSGVGATDALLLEKAQSSVARLITGVLLSDRLPNELFLARAAREELGLRRQVSLFVLVRRLT